jgi:hypothetical protein
MKYSSLILYFLLSSAIFAEITVDTTGFNETINKTTKKAYEYDKRKAEEARRRAIEWARTHPTTYSPSIESKKSSVNSSSSAYKTSSTRESKSNGVKKVYPSAKGAHGQNLYVIICRNGRSKYEVWQKSSGLWMSGSTSFGHFGETLNQVAEDYCR